MARRLKRVHELFSSVSEQVSTLACSVVANVEQYSHARLWYQRSHSEASQLLEAPAVPPPPPLVLYSHAPPVPPTVTAIVLTPSDPPSPAPPPAPSTPMPSIPAAALSANHHAGMAELSDKAILEIPQLACQLHPWNGSSTRRNAVRRIAATLLAAWRRGAHDPVCPTFTPHLTPSHSTFPLAFTFALTLHAPPPTLALTRAPWPPLRCCSTCSRHRWSLAVSSLPYPATTCPRRTAHGTPPTTRSLLPPPLTPNPDAKPHPYTHPGTPPSMRSPPSRSSAAPLSSPRRTCCTTGCCRSASPQLAR